MLIRSRWIALFSLVTVALIIAVTAAMWRGRFGSATTERWNVLLITLDTTRADRLGCYGYRHAETPTLDAISQQSVRYERCYSPVSLTLPSHCTLMTGLLPPRHGIHDNGRDALSPQSLTLAEILHADGYSTSAVIAAFVLDHQFGLNQGFDNYDDDLSQGTKGSRFQFAERNAQLVTDRALSLWNESGEAAKFLWVHYFDPHAPYSPPGYDPTFASQSGYDAEISFVDQQLKRLLAAAEQTAGDTLVVITGDHGESLGEHGEETHGYFVYDATLRVPLLVRFPDGRAAGQIIQTPVSLTDVLPSLLGWLGLDEAATGNDLDGEILPLAGSPSQNEPQRAIYIESQTPAKYGWSPLVGMIAGTDKLILSPQPERYDLAADPYEEHNLFAVNDVRSQQLREQLAELFTNVSQGTLQAAEVEITAQDAAKLHSLGYVSGGAALPPVATIDQLIQGVDPKDMLGVFNRFQEAKALITTGETSAAADILIPLVEADPNVDRFRWSLAVIAAEDPMLRPRIVDCLARALARSKLAQGDKYTLYHLGVALGEEQRLDEALEVFEQLMKLAPDDAEVLRALTDVKTQLGVTHDAEQALQRTKQPDRAK